VCRQTSPPSSLTHTQGLSEQSGGEAAEFGQMQTSLEEYLKPQIVSVVSLSLTGGCLCPGQTHVTVQNPKCTITRALQSK